MDIYYEDQLAPTPTTYTVQSFYNKYTQTPAEIDLSPTFQRDFVWSLSQQAFLVDSILRGFPVPEIYVQETTAADGQQQTIVVDGQQRITSCMRYIDNEFPMPDLDSFSSQWRGKYFSDLDDDHKKRFRAFSFVVRLLPERISLDELRQIFKRLNQTVVALNRSELRNAEYSNEFTELIKHISCAKALIDLGIFSANDYRRKLDEEFIAEIILVIYSESFPNKKQGLEEMFGDFDAQSESSSRAELDDLAKRFGRALAFVEPIAGELKRTRFRNKSDFYSLLSYLTRNARYLDDGRRDEIKDYLVNFGSDVNLLRQDHSNINAIRDSELVETYLEAVQRAASDRLNRVLRNDVLEQLLNPLLNYNGRDFDSNDDIRTWIFESDNDSEADQE